MSKRAKPGRYGLRFLTCTLAAPTIHMILSGGPQAFDPEILKPYLVLGVFLGVFHIIIRPILKLLALLPGCLIALFSGLLVDIGLIYLSAYLVPAIPIPSVIYAVLTSAVINIICGILSLF